MLVEEGLEKVKKELKTSKIVGAIFLGVCGLVICQLVSSLFYLIPLPNIITSIFFGITYVLLSYFFILILCNKVFNYSFSECLIGKPKVNFLWLILGIILPVAVSILLILTPGYFINNEKSTIEVINKVIISIFTVGLGAGVVEEMFFRGFIMHVLEQKWGKIVSIIVPSIIFGLLHTIGGMNLTDILMLFVAGTSVGIMFSLITYESGTIWSSAIVHGIWNVIVIGGVLDIGIRHNFEAIYSYIITSKSVLLTGGRFGIEASGISIISYIIIIGFTLYKMNKKKDIIESI